MVLQHSNVKVSFFPKEEGKKYISVKTASQDSHFHCEEIVADFFKQDLSISLSGFFDGGARVTGTLKADTESQLSLLRFVGSKLAQHPSDDAQSDVKNARLIVEKELERVLSTVEETRSVVSEVLKIYADDFDWHRDSLKRALRLVAKKYNKSLFYELPYDNISSFLSISDPEKENKEGISISNRLTERISFASSAISVIGHKYGSVLSANLDVHLKDFTHDLTGFFRIRQLGGAWKDTEGHLVLNQDSARLELSLAGYATGDYEVTAYLKSFYSSEIIWANGPDDNLIFSLNDQKTKKLTLKSKATSTGIRKLSFSSYDLFSNWCLRHVCKPGFGSHFLKMLKELSLKDQELVFTYYSEALRRASKKASAKSLTVLRAFRLLGVSDLLMVTPEGPHAMAGGLSQVIIGLSAALMEEHCYVTLVSPLYHLKNGNHHQSAEHIIKNGIQLYGKHCTLKPAGHFYLEDYKQGDGVSKHRLIQVYEAKLKRLRIFFVHNQELSDQLYGGISGEDSLRRASFLSRSALEIIKRKEYSCNPDIIMTHDWNTSLVRAYQLLLEDYSTVPNLKIPLMHVLHNAGAAYQGRFRIKEGEENVWDVLGFDSNYQKLFLENDTLLNLSKGSCAINYDGILTVSKPYAVQLTNKSETDPLAKVLQAKKDILYGISNGIPTLAVRKAAFKDRNLGGGDEITIAQLHLMKSRIKSKIQAKYNLKVSPNNILAVLVGRLTDQKGLSLLTETIKHNKSALEVILEQSKELQIIIAGPPSRGDSAFEKLAQLVKTLDKNLLDRFKYRFEFVPHSEAIELTTAADFFLMPSKYEPGGIAQLEALAVGTSVVAHRVGGLSATLSQYQNENNNVHGNSFLFDKFEPEGFLDAMHQAYHCMLKKNQREMILDAAFKSKNDWRDRVPYYLSMFQKTVGVFDLELFVDGKFKTSRLDLLSKVQAKD